MNIPPFQVILSRHPFGDAVHLVYPDRLLKLLCSGEPLPGGLLFYSVFKVLAVRLLSYVYHYKKQHGQIMAMPKIFLFILMKFAVRPVHHHSLISIDTYSNSI